MSSDPDIRWRQRLGSFDKALGQLADAVELSRQRELSDLERQGLIKAFEFTHELAWNVMNYLALFRAFQARMREIADSGNG